MADHDRAAARREITDALIAALDRRHEVLDAIVDAENRAAAVEAVTAERELHCGHGGIAHGSSWTGSTTQRVSFGYIWRRRRGRNASLTFSPASFR
jgi:hypothetical protein